MANTSYRRLMAVEARDAKGFKVVLALQERTRPDRDTHLCVSWRSTLWPDGPSRRFYNYKGEPWSVGALLAYRLITQFESEGGLADISRDQPFAAIAEVRASTEHRHHDTREIPGGDDHTT